MIKHIATPRSALVFGGSRGIGAAIATRLAADGYRVALTYVSQPNRAEAVTQTIRDRGGAGIAIQADSADAQAIIHAVATASKEFGGLDTVVVNAGVLRMGRLATLSLEDIDEMLAINVRGVVLAIKAAAETMRDGGRVITIGSNTAIRPGLAEGALYAMTKAAVAALVKGIALDLASREITVNNVQPGPTETDMTASMLDQVRTSMPLGRVIQPTEIAGLVSYLAGPEASSITGASLTIDGGFIL